MVPSKGFRQINLNAEDGKKRADENCQVTPERRSLYIKEIELELVCHVLQVDPFVQFLSFKKGLLVRKPDLSKTGDTWLY